MVSQIKRSIDELYDSVPSVVWRVAHDSSVQVPSRFLKEIVEFVSVSSVDEVAPTCLIAQTLEYGRNGASTAGWIVDLRPKPLSHCQALNTPLRFNVPLHLAPVVPSKLRFRH